MKEENDTYDFDVPAIIKRISSKDFVMKNQELDLHLKVNEDLYTFEKNFEDLESLISEQYSYNEIEYITILHEDKGILTLDFDSENLIKRGKSAELDLVFNDIKKFFKVIQSE